jgi:hypothetical protein
MKRIESMGVFACGCLTAALVGWAVPHVRAQGSPDTSDAIHVCIATDGVVRAVELSAPCPSDQRSVLLKKKTLDPDAPKSGDEPKPGSEAGCSDKQTLDELERRLKTLEASPNGRIAQSRVVAPFEVVDRAGKRVFYVTADNGPSRAEVYNPAGIMVASVTAAATGGQFAARTGSSGIATYMGIYGEGKAAGLAVLEDGIRRLDFGRDAETGKYRLKIFGKGGAVAAAIGQEPQQGGGAAVVYDVQGRPRANIAVGLGSLAGRGLVTVVGDDTKSLAELREGDNAGGFLGLYGANGLPMVEAGVTAEGFGVVRAGPASFKPGMGLFGLPGSYISGKSK